MRIFYLTLLFSLGTASLASYIIVTKLESWPYFTTYIGSYCRIRQVIVSLCVTPILPRLIIMPKNTLRLELILTIAANVVSDRGNQAVLFLQSTIYLLLILSINSLLHLSCVHTCLEKTTRPSS